eukprot:11413556-Ditylum_brightwellii.AAC.1
MRTKKKQTSIREYFTNNGTTKDTMEGLTKSEEETEYNEVEYKTNEQSKESSHELSKLEAEINHHSGIPCNHGNNLDLTTKDKGFRLYFQNVNRIIMKNEGVEFLDKMMILKKIGALMSEKES